MTAPAEILDSANSRYLSIGDAAPRARKILEKKIEEGRASAMALFERLATDVPHDAVVRGRAMGFKVPRDGEEVMATYGTRAADGQKGSLTITYGDEAATIHPYALAQLAQRAGVPGGYLADLATGHEWQKSLATTILNEHFHQENTNKRYLVRTVHGQVRGVLSDKFRRLDNRPLAEGFASECQAIGAVPVDGIFSDTRVSLRALLPRVYEPIPGEVLAFGIEWGNSDYGAALNSIRAFILRVWCLNGATMENILGQVHLGRQLSDDLELSAKTYQLDTRTSLSAMRDVIRGVLSDRKVEALCAGIRSANDKQINWKSLKGSLSKQLLKTEMQAAEQAFESQDVYNLPPGNTMWRASNAISWIAGGKDVLPDRKLELQRLAGQLIDGRRDPVGE